MDVNAATAVECKAGQQTLDIKAANGTASFKCGTDLDLDPAYQTNMTAYESTESTNAVPLTNIVPNAKFTTTADAAPQTNTEQPSAAGGAATVSTYHLNVPELPATDKTVVFKCVAKKAQSAPTPPSQAAAAAAPETPETKGCVMIIKVAKSAASIAASPIAAVGSIALAVLASVAGQGF
ncbi:hypothetical protein CSUI_009619 [Cystoisospora suis]|uniref:SRS domain-containing protein n=1 Tax=Cystoisospora suis TaxID=483139 RepID=A0A2C6KHH0_9APIC|nr:hypothetical protein CSUI_009619 [Cystoisospora suis]